MKAAHTMPGAPRTGVPRGVLACCLVNIPALNMFFREGATTTCGCTEDVVAHVDRHLTVDSRWPR